MKNFIIKIAAICGAVGAVHVGLFVLAGEPGIPLMMDDLDRIGVEGPDIVYLGDSCVLDHAPDDVDTRSLPEMLDERLLARRVVGAAHNAYHGELFTGMCRVIAEGQNPPGAVIIPINLRSFSLSWDLKPEYQFPKMKYLLEHDRVWERAMLRPLIAFNYVDLIPVTQEDFEATPVFVAGREVGVVGEYERPPEVGEDMDAYLGRQFEYIYGHQLGVNHRKLDGIVRAVEVLLGARITPIVYVTPIDHEGVERLTGEAIMKEIRKNVRIVREALAGTNVEVHDFSESLGSAAFCYEHVIHEHLDEEGREFLAGEVARIAGQSD